jgi:hypothetical protein
MNYTQASGLLAEFPNVDSSGHMIDPSTQVGILNASCAGYSLRVQVRAQLNAGDAASQMQAGGDAAAGVGDGSQGDTVSD